MRKLLIALMLFFVFFTKVNALADTATSAIVMDIDSGRVLYKKNANEKRLIASITKIMTAVVAIENGNIMDIVTAGEEILDMYGTNIYLELNEQMTLLDLLYGLLLRSGNDAAIVIACHISKNEKTFVNLMNKKAKEIGMNNTIFNNSHGLDEKTQNYSTAYDMALLSAYANKIPIYCQISSSKKWIVVAENKTYVWYNRNKLLSLYKYAVGGKNGYTPKAGRTLVTTANKDGLRLTAVTLNDPNEYESHISLYEYAYKKYITYQLIDKYTFNIEDGIYKNNVYIKNSFNYPLTQEELKNITTTAYLNKNINQNNVVGVLEVLLDQNKIFEENIYIKQSTTKKSKWKKVKDFFINLFSCIFN